MLNTKYESKHQIQYQGYKSYLYSAPGHVVALLNSLIILLLCNASSSYGSGWEPVVPIKAPKATYGHTGDINVVESDIVNDAVHAVEHTEEPKGHKQEKWYLLYGFTVPIINHPEPTRSLIDASKQRKGSITVRAGWDGGIYIPINKTLMAGVALNLLGETVEDKNGFGVGVFLGSLGASVLYFPSVIGRGWFLRGDLGQARGAQINSGPAMWFPGSGNQNHLGRGVVFRVGAGYSWPIIRGTRIALSISSASWGFDEGTWRTMGFSLAGLF